jgi:lincosamide nucleotidyltransferase A/C/D/E
LEDAVGSRVDAHPLTFDEAGDGWQANLSGEPYRWPREHLEGRGRVGGREVRCITPELQIQWHGHEDFDDVDWADIHALARRFGLPDPGPRPGFVSPRRAVERKVQPRNWG